jgi:PAS domain S-box-containing protein
MRCNSSHLARPLFAIGALLYHTAIVACAPSGSRPPTLLAQSLQQGFWHQHKWTIILAVALLATAGLLVVGLRRERRRKKSHTQSPAEAVLIKREEFSTLIENSPDIICRLDRDLRHIYVSPALEVVSGAPIASFIGKTVRESATPGFDWRDFEAACRAAIESRRLVHHSFTYDERHYSTRMIPEFSPDGSVESIMTITEDVTDRIRAERELVQLTTRLFDIQDQERRRIARELHDGTAQNLFAISINLQKLTQLNSESEEVQRLIAECQSLDEQSLKEIRTLSYLLHPPLLDQAGLVSALQWYVEGFTKRSGVFVKLYAEPIGRLQPDVEMALFRVVQEALSNVRRHAASETASIRLARVNGEVVLRIQDQGKGLAIAECSPDTNGAASLGVGIPGMKQRLRQLGGTLNITSNHGGTTVSAVVPIAKGVDYGTNTGG